MIEAFRSLQVVFRRRFYHHLRQRPLCLGTLSPFLCSFLFHLASRAEKTYSNLAKNHWSPWRDHQESRQLLSSWKISAGSEALDLFCKAHLVSDWFFFLDHFEPSSESCLAPSTGRYNSERALCWDDSSVDSSISRSLPSRLSTLSSTF